MLSLQHYFNNILQHWQHLLTTQDAFHFGEADTLCDLNAIDVTFVAWSAVHWSNTRGVSGEKPSWWYLMPLCVTQHVTQVHWCSTVVRLISLLEHIDFFQLHSRLWMMIVTNLQQ